MHTVQDLIDIALKEDIGSGDITTENSVDESLKGEGRIIAKETLVVAGLGVAKSVFRTLDPQVEFHHDCRDGSKMERGEVIVAVAGRLRCLLMGERTALNFLQHLSGVATFVRSHVDALKDKKVRLVDTRKTLPGFRVLEKYAVRVGGARNHRMGLYDGVLIKDNHIAACGGITAAVDRVRKGISHLEKIEVEVSDSSGVSEALAAGVDVIMLDNMDLGQIRAAAKQINGQAVIEVSGGLTKGDLVRLADTGVDIISMGALTHTAPSVDISMQLNLQR